MHIGWIGGRERNESQLKRIAEAEGHVLEFHSGHVGGRGAPEMRALVERCHLVVIVTDVNSHGAVLLAKRLASKVGRGTLVIRRCGGSRFQALLKALAIRDQHLGGAPRDQCPGGGAAARPSNLPDFHDERLLFGASAS